MLKTITKKDGTLQEWKPEKIIIAVKKSAERVMETFSDYDLDYIVKFVRDKSNEYALDNNTDTIPVAKIHNIVEAALDKVNPAVAASYRDYRNYKTSFVGMMDEVYRKSQSIMYIGDKENSNTDSALVSTKRSLIFNQLNKELYKKFFLTTEELQACREGYIYIHDMSARRDTMNCCLFDVENVLAGGFEMGNLWYNEPKTLDTAFDVIGDIVLSAASQQYGGFTVPQVDKILEKYARKSYKKYFKEYMDIATKMFSNSLDALFAEIENYKEEKKQARKYALNKLEHEFRQGFQGWEYKFNSVSSSRGDYPFITMTCGLATSVFGKMASIAMLNVRRDGQGKKGNKKPVLFPKIVFLYDENFHGKGKPLEDVFEAGVECSAKAMYPDWLSLTGEGYVPSMYKKYGEVISPMGCVDGKEIISYRLDDKLYVESFERMWAKMSERFEVKSQYVTGNPNLYIDLKGVEIYDTEKGFVDCKRIIRNISDKWVDVHLSNGRRLLCTPDHPLHTLNKGTLHAENLSKGDKLRINSNQVYDEKILFNSDRAWLLGVMLCDGCYQNGHLCLSIAAKDEDEIENKFTSIVNNHFGLPTKTVLQERGQKGTYKDIIINSKGKNSLSKLSSYFITKFEGINKSDRHIPNEVFEWDYVSKLSFLAGMIDADGYINPVSHGGSVIQLGSTNKELALQQMALAQALDMPAKIYFNHYSKSDSDKIRYRVEFYPSDDLLEYIVCQKKLNNFKKAVDGYYNIDAEVIDVIPIFNRTDYSYDVTTESEHFEVSGIYSHNCRAFLSPWYERGGMTPADENDKPVFVGRFNIGAISLHLPMILAKARRENKDFYEVLDFYMEMIRKIHIRTYEYLGQMKASTNPLAYCEGGFYGGHLGIHDKIKPLLKSATASFGITALNELQQLYNGKSIAQDGQFALEVMEYINNKITDFKEMDGNLYAIYGKEGCRNKTYSTLPKGVAA